MQRTLFGDDHAPDATKIGQGHYGTVFRLGGDYEAWLAHRGGGGCLLLRRRQQKPKFIAVKAVLFDDSAEKEATIHRDITRRSAERNIKIVPDLYCAFVLFPPQDAPPLMVMAMEYVEGAPLVQRFRDDPMPDAVFAAVSDMFHALWSFGYIHGDLHWNNVLVTDDDRVMLIDLGRTIEVPDHIKPMVRARRWTAHNFLDAMDKYAAEMGIVSNAGRLFELSSMIDKSFANLLAADVTTAIRSPPTPPARRHNPWNVQANGSSSSSLTMMRTDNNTDNNAGWKRSRSQSVLSVPQSWQNN